MKQLRINTKYVLIGVLLGVFYFLSRIANLTDLPIFTDEAIYIRWAQIAKNDASWRFIPLTDGKQPLFVWAMMISLRFIGDPLFAGRIVSVFTGFISMIGIGFAAWEIFKDKRIALFSSLLYLVSPFSLMYDRMALMDGMVAAFALWSMYFALLLVRLNRLDVSLILGFILGGGVLNKTSGFINIYLLPLTLLFFNLQKKNFWNRFAKWFGLVLLSILLSQLYYGILRLSPWFHMIAQKDATFVYPINEWLEHPFRFILGNLNGLFDWLTGYLTLPIMILIFISLLFIQKNSKEKFFLFLWFFIPFTALALFGKVLYPRFILFMSLPLLILASWGLVYVFSRLKTKSLKLLLLILFIIYPLYVDLKILFSIVTAPIPYPDLGQYVNDWPAGWGIREVVDILGRESKDKKIAVYTDGTFGLLPYGLEIYLVDNPNVEIRGLWPIPRKMPEEIIAAVEKQQTYLVLNKTEELSKFWNAELLETYNKGSRKDRSLRFYRLKKPAQNFDTYSEDDILFNQ